MISLFTFFALSNAVRALARAGIALVDEYVPQILGGSHVVSIILDG